MITLYYLSRVSNGRHINYDPIEDEDEAIDLFSSLIMAYPNDDISITAKPYDTKYDE